MPLLSNGQELFSMLEKSQLLDEEYIAKLRPQMEKHKQTDPKKLAATLLKNQLITEYQAKQLVNGKYKGFYLARYKLMELLGMGGMGRVYLAEQISMERLVAIKLINIDKGKKQHEQALARFKREAKAVAALHHPNIIQAFDFSDENGLPYIVMEYVEGIDTARIVHKFGPIHWQQVAEYGRQAAEGLQHAHKAGLVHRDIKPGNLLVDSSGHVKILDLGLVSAFDQKKDDSLTVDQDQLGTVDYIAPEQAIDSKSVDARADIYSLGATLYSIMTGRILYPDKTTAQKLLLHQTTAPESITNLVKDIPAELAAVIDRMLAKKPDQRYQSAQEVAEALKKFAQPKSPPYELNAIKYSRVIYEGFLGKCPEAAKITVPTLGSPEVEKPAAGAREAASQMGGKLRQASMINAGSSDPALDDFSMSGDDYTQLAMDMPSVVRKKKKRKKNQVTPIQIVAVVGSLLGLMLAGWLGSNAIRAFGKTDTPGYVPPVQSAPPVSPGPAAPAATPAPAAPANPVEAVAYQPVDIKSGATSLTTEGMFNSPTDLNETMVFQDWGTKVFEHVPFQLIAPQPGQPNAIMLHGTIGGQAPKKPKQVTIPVNSPAKAIHLLSGVAGYGYPMTRDPLTALVVRLRYDDGQTEEHRFINGRHFADYIKRNDVPESVFAFDLKGKQLRYLWLNPKRPNPIQNIEFAKDGDNGISPIVMAMTVQLPDKAVATKSPSGPVRKSVKSPPRSSRPILQNKETVTETAWRDSITRMLADPDLVACHTFDESTIGADVVKNLARSTEGRLALKLVGAKVAAGRFPGKKSIRFNPDVFARAEYSVEDSSALQLHENFTIAIWFKVSQFNRELQTLIAKGDSSWRIHRAEGTDCLALHLNPTPLAVMELNGSYVANDARWHQVVAVNSPRTNGMSIYMDGYLDVETYWTVKAQANNFPVWLGNSAEPTTPRGFDGWIDEVAIWKKDLDALEVKRLFLRGNPEQ